jgi:hypothetical protein
MIRGTIRNGGGESIDAQFSIYADADDRIRIHDRYDDMGFRFMRLPKEPFAIRLSMPGYRDQLLVSGQDFEVGDVGLDIVLVEGNFTADEDVWEAVTGTANTAENIDRIPGGKRLFRDIEYLGRPRRID